MVAVAVTTGAGARVVLVPLEQQGPMATTEQQAAEQQEEMVRAVRHRFISVSEAMVEEDMRDSAPLAVDRRRDGECEVEEWVISRTHHSLRYPARSVILRPARLAAAVEAVEEEVVGQGVPDPMEPHQVRRPTMATRRITRLVCMDRMA